MRNRMGRLWYFVLFIPLVLGSLIFSFHSQDNRNREVMDTWIPYKKMENNQVTNYTFQLKFDEVGKRIKGKVSITIPNTSKKKLEELYFHLYPNAFKNWKWGELTKPETEGSITINKVMVNQKEVYPHTKDTLMKINLPLTLKPNEVVYVDIDFDLKLPKKGLRLTHVNETYFLAQWYPMLAVYDEEGWHLDPYTITGDPFFTEVADYEVYITLPKGYDITSTSVDPVVSKNGGQNIHLIQKKVRDFAIMISKDYEKLQAKTHDGITVKLHYLPNQQEVAGLLLGGAVEAIEYFNKSFGTYPLKELDVVLIDGEYGIAGMEYPGLVTSNPVVQSKEKIFPAYHVVAHEIAHQWWYSTVGNNQVKEPWLDEGITSYSEYLFMEKVLHRNGIEQMMENIRVYTNEISKRNKLNVLQPIYTYGDFYGALVYGRPAAMLWELKTVYGEDKVNKILHTYYETYKDKIATTEDFIKVTNEIIGKDMTPFFHKWFLLTPQK